MPTARRRWPLASKDPRTPTTALSFSNASVVAGSSRSTRLLAQVAAQAVGQRIDVDLEPEPRARRSDSRPARHRRWRDRRSLRAGAAYRPRRPRRRRCRSERSAGPGRASVPPGVSTCVSRARAPVRVVVLIIAAAAVKARCRTPVIAVSAKWPVRTCSMRSSLSPATCRPGCCSIASRRIAADYRKYSCRSGIHGPVLARDSLYVDKT